LSPYFSTSAGIPRAFSQVNRAKRVKKMESVPKPRTDAQFFRIDSVTLLCPVNNMLYMFPLHSTILSAPIPHVRRGPSHQAFIQKARGEDLQQGVRSCSSFHMLCQNTCCLQVLVRFCLFFHLDAGHPEAIARFRFEIACRKPKLRVYHDSQSPPTCNMQYTKTSVAERVLVLFGTFGHLDVLCWPS
jgi:hypothetical protein